MPRLLILLCCYLGISCSKQPTFDPRTVETDAGAAVVRQLIADCPYVTAERPMNVSIGPAQLPVTPEFKARFPEYKDRLIDHSQVTRTLVADKLRFQQKSTTTTAGPLVLLLQVSELVPASGNYEATAAWAFKDEMLRRKYSVTPQPDGSYKVSAGEILEQKKPPEPNNPNNANNAPSPAKP